MQEGFSSWKHSCSGSACSKYCPNKQLHFHWVYFDFRLTSQQLQRKELSGLLFHTYGVADRKPRHQGENWGSLKRSGTGTFHNKQPDGTSNLSELQNTSLSLKLALLLPFLAFFFPLAVIKYRKVISSPSSTGSIRFLEKHLTWNLFADSHQELVFIPFVYVGNGAPSAESFDSANPWTAKYERILPRECFDSKNGFASAPDSTYHCLKGHAQIPEQYN